jgi:cytochrome c556
MPGAEFGNLSDMAVAGFWTRGRARNKARRITVLHMRANTVPNRKKLCKHGMAAHAREVRLMVQRSMSRVLVTGTVFAALALDGAVAWAADEPANIVKYRQNFMKANSAHLGMIAAIVKGEVSLTDEIAPHAEALAEQGKLASANLQQLFPEGTGKGAAGIETHALPVIWEQWDEFEQAAQNFEEESAKLAEVAAGGDMTAIAQQVGAFGKKACGGCHEDFREKQD